MMDKICEITNAIWNFLLSLKLWIKISAVAVVVLVVFVIIAIILKRKKEKRIAAEKRRKMEELNEAISNEKKGD